MHQGYMHQRHIYLGHTAWAPEGREGRSQEGPKGRKTSSDYNITAGHEQDKKKFEEHVNI